MVKTAHVCPPHKIKLTSSPKVTFCFGFVEKFRSSLCKPSLGKEVPECGPWAQLLRCSPFTEITERANIQRRARGRLAVEDTSSLEGDGDRPWVEEAGKSITHRKACVREGGVWGVLVGARVESGAVAGLRL